MKVSRRCQVASYRLKKNLKREMQSYKDLEIYRLAHELAVEIHEMTMSLPNFELFEEGSQI